VNQFTAEVDALRQEIAKALSEAAVIISTMVRYAEKEWDHFLHDTDVGRVLDHVGQMCKGVFIEAEGLVQSFWTLDLARAVVDPKGFWHSVSGAVDKLESLTGLDGEQSLKESWKELGKDTVHWDEWSTNPFEAAGESAFDLATVLLPGGALEKLPMLGRAAAEVAEAPKDLHLPVPGRLPDPAPHDNPPPRSEPPRSAQPQPAPQPDPAPKPKAALPPYGLTESKTPVGQKPPVVAPKPAPEPAIAAAHADPSTPKAVSHEPATTPPMPVLGAQPHGGAPSAYQPQSLAHDHHGPVAHADDQVTASLTSEDLSALNNYTGLGHEDLNDALRTNTVDASQHARVEALNRALEKLPPHIGTVVRGTDLPVDVFERYQPDAVVTEYAFISASKEPAVAQSSAFAGNVEFRILSRSGRDISSFSLFPSEQEVLFPNGMQFYVVDRKSDPDTGRTIIEMIER
ncbi:MAG: ADP-ribosyltransferase, partial [Mycobacterium sp.]|uniref:ADP-ribosyltransferase n=1 Tax=Mycobacterium sp. TaxID=1785 RepID=UPI003C72DF8A